MQDHLLTLDEWAALAEDTSRWYELVDGVVVAAPRQGSNHQWVMGQLLAQLVAQLPPRLAVLYGMEVTVFEAFPPTVRVPDLVVVPEAVGRTSLARFAAADVQLAVEVVWAGSRRTDRVTKPSEYAEAAIPNYWIVDTEPATITVFELVDREYKRVTETSTTLSVTAPVPLSVDVRSLLP
ncbi:Uma2 family endonuclease [Kibdelosporangium lantanae]